MGVYVFQVTAGEESRAAERLRRHAAGLINDCFVPTVEVPVRHAGVWSRVIRPLIMGYVFVDTADIEQVRRAALAAPGFARLLTAGEQTLPLTNDELSWLNSMCGRDSRMLPISSGVIEGGVTRIKSGPLVGREVSIRKIDRHKRLAYVEVQMFGRTLLVQVGLEITSKTAA